MPPSVMFHDGNRQLQDQFDSRRIADRLEEKLTRFAFTDQDRAFIEGAFDDGAIRVNGTARVVRDDPLMQRFAGAQLLVRVKVRAIFPNCPRYIVTPGTADPSTYAPRPGYAPPEPAWKGFDDFKDYIHPRQKTPDGE